MPNVGAIRILAKEANQKGDLFGRLMEDLFLSLGYDNVRLNVARSGREIDIEAAHRLESRWAIGEAKAVDERVGGAEVNKFAGKLRPERNKRQHTFVTGYFISLSGFTETAIDQEGESGDEAVILLNGSQVTEELIKGRIVVSPATAAVQAGRLVGQDLRLDIDTSHELLAHRTGWIWAIYLSHNKQRTHVALIHADGTPISAKYAASVIEDDSHVDGTMSNLICLNPDSQELDGVRLQRALSRYHDYLGAECGYILLDGMPADAEVGALRLRLESLFVPLHVSIEAANASVRIPAKGRKFLKRVTFGSTLQAHHRIAILAVPGAGKSTLLKRLAVAYSDPNRRTIASDELPDRDWLPLFFRCRELREKARAPFLELLNVLAGRALIGEDAPSFRAYLEAKLQVGDVLLLVDGLDEISDVGDRAAFVRNLRTFLAVYPNVNLVVSSRRVGFRHVASLLASVCMLADVADFDATDINNLTVSWHREVLGDRPEILFDAKRLASTICENRRIKQLAANPLLLTTLLLVKRWVGQLPTRRSVLYGKAVEVLLMTWNVEGHEPIEQEEALPQLCYLAFAMMSRGIQKISRLQLNQFLTHAREDLIAELGFARIGVSDFIERIESRSSLLMMTGHDVVNGTLMEFYEFRHLTFQEYLTARAVTEGWHAGRSEDDNLVSALEPHLNDEKWREVIPLAAILAGRKSESLIQKLIESCRNRVAPSHLSILGMCLADEVHVRPETVRSALRVLIDPQGFRYWAGVLNQMVRGKYGQLLKEEAGRAYLAGTVNFSTGLVLGKIVASKVDADRGTVWDLLKPKFLSADSLTKCEAALALPFAGPIAFEQRTDAASCIVNLICSDLPSEQLAGCFALRKLGGKRGFGFVNGDSSPSITFFAENDLVARLLTLWLLSEEREVSTEAMRTLCSLPLRYACMSPTTSPIYEAFFLRLQNWIDLNAEERSACLIVAFYLGTPWNTETLLNRSRATLEDPGSSRRRRIRQIVALLDDDAPGHVAAVIQ
jgi:energy-coupling factor transporter ATP-binding protein EcfA2